MKNNKKYNQCSVLLKNIFHRVIKSDESISIRNKTKTSALAIILGILVSGIFIYMLGNNAYYVISDIFNGAFISTPQIHNLLRIFGCFIVAGLAVAFAFKTGLFNIGVSGQMLIAGGIATIIGVKYNLNWFLLIFIAIFIGAMTAGVSGVLKAFFNVHEVVSTLLLNWVWFYLMQWLTKTGSSYMDNLGNSNDLMGGSLISGENARTIVILIFAAISVITVIFIFAKTTFGFKLKAVGKNKDASNYAGYSVKTHIILSMVISGMLAGLLGGLVYLVNDQHIQYQKSLALPSIGFSGIAIALLSFNGPIGIVFVALLWGILNIGSTYSAGLNGVSVQIIQMIIGIIIYFAAISNAFAKFKPIYMSRNLFYNFKDENLKSEHAIYLKDKIFLKATFLKKYNKLKKINLDKDLLKKEKAKNKSEISKLKHEYNIKLKKENDTNIKTEILLELNTNINLMKAGLNNILSSHGYNDIKIAKQTHKTQLKILKKEYKSRVHSLIEKRNQTNIIGLYDKYRNDALDIITNYEMAKSKVIFNFIDFKKDLHVDNKKTTIKKMKSRVNNDINEIIKIRNDDIKNIRKIYIESKHNLKKVGK